MKAARLSRNQRIAAEMTGVRFEFTRKALSTFGRRQLEEFCWVLLDARLGRHVTLAARRGSART
jgi:hypothetical protein